MSPSNVAGEAIGTALRHVAMFAIWMILVAAVVVAIVSGLLALRRRQGQVCAIKRQTTRPCPPRAYQAHCESLALGRSRTADLSQRGFGVAVQSAAASKPESRCQAPVGRGRMRRR